MFLSKQKLKIAFVGFIFFILMLGSLLNSKQNITLAKAFAGKTKPNIILILADDLGWNDVGFHGSEIKTPNLDRLAESSTQLDRFYVKAMCTPTRAALMTGRHPFRYGMSSSAMRPWDKLGLPVQEKTIAQTLKEAGYYTAIVGKWHLGHYQKEYLPTERGFDYHYGHYCGGVDYFSHEMSSWIRGGLDWHRNNKPVVEEGYTTDLIGQEAVKIIKNNDYNKSPLFLYVSFNAPHDPLQAKEKDIEKYAEIEDEGRRIYAAQVESMDVAIGEIVKALKEKQIWDDTLLVFTSDNGGSTYQNHTRGDNRPLRGQKGTLYEGGMRVPTLLSYPAKLAGIQVSNLGFSVVDLYPTFANLATAKLAKADKLDGIDILESLKRGSTNRDELLLQYQDRFHAAAMLKGDYKLVKNGMTWYASPYYGTVELFDLKNDPLENENLAQSKPEKVREIQTILASYIQEAKPSILDNSSRPPQNFKIPQVWSPQYLQSEVDKEKDESAKAKNSWRDKLKSLSRTQISLISFFLGAITSYFAVKFLHRHQEQL